MQKVYEKLRRVLRGSKCSRLLWREHTTSWERSKEFLNQLHLYGVDYMSTDNIRGYFGIKYMIKIEWLNDSSCNIVLPSKEVAGQLVEEFTRHDKKQADMKD